MPALGSQNSYALTSYALSNQNRGLEFADYGYSTLFLTGFPCETYGVAKTFGDLLSCIPNQLKNIACVRFEENRFLLCHMLSATECVINTVLQFLKAEIVSSYSYETGNREIFSWLRSFNHTFLQLDNTCASYWHGTHHLRLNAL